MNMDVVMPDAAFDMTPIAWFLVVFFLAFVLLVGFVVIRAICRFFAKPKLTFKRA